MVGKWHLGAVPGMTPMDRGFDEFFGFLHGANSYITTKTPGGATIGADIETAALARVREQRVNPVFRGREPYNEPDYLTDAFGREAVAFIERHKQHPFFLYLPFNAVHAPLQTTAKYLDRVANIKDPRHRTLASMTVAMDDNIGKVIGKVRESGLENDTLVFFLSDNGSPTYNHSGSNDPLNGSKCTLYEGGFRIPFAVKWPGKAPAGKVDHRVVSSLDIVPTLLAAAGLRAPADRELDGVDLIPYLARGNTKAPHEILFFRNGPNSAVRKGNWKLIQIGDSSRLYDLAKDLGEKTNVAAAHPEVVKELRAAWGAWNAEMVAPLWEPHGKPKIPVNGETIEWYI
jgi:arylsulfatase A-like enzyme